MNIDVKQTALMPYLQALNETYYGKALELPLSHIGSLGFAVGDYQATLVRKRAFWRIKLPGAHERSDRSSCLLRTSFLADQALVRENVPFNQVFLVPESVLPDRSTLIYRIILVAV